ncbi:oxidoreductase [Xylariaceae sp. FL1272]|nr:oxidoreductase [Xylariaceae sp. FL1272]
MAPTRVAIVGLKPRPAEVHRWANDSNDGKVDISGQLGFWAVKAHLPALQSMPENYDIVAVCNSTIDSAALAIEQYGLTSAKPYGNPDDLAADSNVDLVVISVNVRKHFELAKPALEKKKDVFVEWPLGASVAQAEELTQLAARMGVRTSVGVQARADPLIVKLKEIVESDQLGNILSSSVLVNSSFLPLSGWIEGAEYYLNHDSGGNELLIYFGHFLDSFIHVLGDFAEVQAIMKSVVKSVPVFNEKKELRNPGYPKTSADHFVIHGVLESDALASFSVRKGPNEVDGASFRWVISGTKGEAEVIIPRGQFQTGEPNRTLRVRIGDEDAENVDLNVPDDEFGTKLANRWSANPARQYRAFAAGNKNEFADFESALRTHKLLGRIVEAAGWPSI